MVPSAKYTYNLLPNHDGKNTDGLNRIDEKWKRRRSEAPLFRWVFPRRRGQARGGLQARRAGGARTPPVYGPGAEDAPSRGSGAGQHARAAQGCASPARQRRRASGELRPGVASTSVKTKPLGVPRGHRPRGRYGALPQHWESHVERTTVSWQALRGCLHKSRSFSESCPPALSPSCRGHHRPASAGAPPLGLVHPDPATGKEMPRALWYSSCRESDFGAKSSALTGAAHSSCGHGGRVPAGPRRIPRLPSHPTGFSSGKQ